MIIIKKEFAIHYSEFAKFYRYYEISNEYDYNKCKQ